MKNTGTEIAGPSQAAFCGSGVFWSSSLCSTRQSTLPDALRGRASTSSRRSRPKAPPQVIYLRAGLTPPPLANPVGLLRGMLYGAIGGFMLWVLIAIVWRLMRGG